MFRAAGIISRFRQLIARDFPALPARCEITNREIKETSIARYRERRI
jgi:hypothetical protein